MSLNQYCLYLLSRYTPKSKQEMTRWGQELLEFVAQAHHLQANLAPSNATTTTDTWLRAWKPPPQMKKVFFFFGLFSFLG